MEGRYGIYIMHRHRHNPVRATSSRDPCLDHPASRGRTATTQPVVVTPPAVPAGNTLLPSPYTGTIKVGRHLGAGTDWMAGLKRLMLVLRKHRDGACRAWCLGHNDDP